MISVLSMIHNGMGLAHSLITSLMAIYIINGYLGMPLGTQLDSTSQSVLLFGMSTSLVYFLVSTIIMLLEPKNRNRNALIFHHVIAYIAIITSFYTDRYMSFYGMWYIMEVSSIFLCVRDTARSVTEIKSLLLDMIFVVSYILSRFPIPIYIYRQLVSMLLSNFHDVAFIVIITIATISLSLNTMWLYQIYKMIQRNLHVDSSDQLQNLMLATILICLVILPTLLVFDIY